MTTGRRPTLGTPALDLQTFASGQTVRARDAQALAELCNDAATGRPGQTFWHGRETDISGSTISWWYYPSDLVRFLRLWHVCSSYMGGTSNPNMTLALTITDSAGNSIGPVAAEIPAVYSATMFSVPNLRPNRLDTFQVYEDSLDVLAINTAGVLKANAPWRFTLVVTPADGVLECCGLEETPRPDLDTADGAGVVLDGLHQRHPITETEWGQVLGTTRSAYASRRQTYLALSVPEEAPMTTSAVAWAELSGAGQESAGTAKRWRHLARDARNSADEHCVWCFRYYLDGAPGDTADLRIVTGAGTYTVAGLATIGAWTDVLDEDCYVETGGATDAYLEGQVSVGTATLKVCAVQVVSEPT